MDKRHNKRIVVNINAELVSSAKNYTGFIENISEFGIKWYQYAGDIENITENNLEMLSAIDFTVGSTLELKFSLPSGKTLFILCKVKWLKKMPPDGHMNSIGMEIIDAHPGYKEFLKSL